MKLFTVGPVEMFPDTLEVATKQLPYFRTPEFSQIMFENEEMFKQSIHAPKEAKTVFLTASGTGAMEAAVINCFTEENRLLVISGGGFGKRFAEICAIHRIPYDELMLDFGETLTEEKLEKFDGRQYDALLVNLHETSTGQLYDIELLANYCEKYNLYFVVDAISAYGADKIDFAKHKIDVLIASSQKALALSPGIAIVEISRRIYEERVLTIQQATLYFDFKSHIDNMKRGQTPFTPAVGILLELHERLEKMQQLGMDNIQKDMRELADRFRRELQKRGFRLPSYPMSNALTPVILEPHAKSMYERLKQEYGLVVTPNGGSLAEVLIRVGHLGNVCWQDYEKLLIAMQQIRATL